MKKKMSIEKVFPLILIGLNIAAAIVYAIKGEAKMAIYWVAAAVLNICVTF